LPAQQALPRQQPRQARFVPEVSNLVAARTPCWDQPYALTRPEREWEPAAVSEQRFVQAPALERAAVPEWRSAPAAEVRQRPR